jgi:ribosomal-protein-serine acetyltransferase
VGDKIYLKEENDMTIEVDSEIELKQLEPSDAKDIFETIDLQRDYLGRWLPFVAQTKDISDTEKFVDSVVNASEDQFEYVFTIRKYNQFIGLIGIKQDSDKMRSREQIEQ